MALADLFPGAIERFQPLLGQLHRLIGHAARAQRVGVRFAHHAAPGGARLIQRRIGRKFQQIKRIGRRTTHEPRLHRAKTGRAQAEDLGDRAQERVLGRVQVAIRQRDVKQPLKQVAQHRIARREQRGDLAGIGVEPGDVLPRQIEHPRGMRFIRGRDGKDGAEHRHLVARHNAVGLGQLGPQRDHADGKGDAAFGPGAQPVEHRRQRFPGAQRLDGIGDP